MDMTHIAYCGVDCAACPDYLTGKCPDCRHSEWPDGDACMPIVCCQRKGIDCCGRCDVFPCGDMTGFYEESESHRAACVRMAEVREKGEVSWI